MKFNRERNSGQFLAKISGTIGTCLRSAKISALMETRCHCLA